MKTQFAKDLKLGGVMIFALDSDDYTGKCQSNITYPLIRTIRDTLLANVTVTIGKISSDEEEEKEADDSYDFRSKK